MRVVTVSRILNEDDIVEAFVRHNATFVDHMVFLDNGSTDRTLDILRRLQTEGIALSVFQARAVTFDEIAVNTWLYRTVDRMHRPGWVIFLDADEFIRCDSPRLAIPLGTRAAEDGAVMAGLEHYFDTNEDDAAEPIVPRRMGWKLRDDPGIFKVIVRGGGGERVAVGPGNHKAVIDRAMLPDRPEPRIGLAHYPRRSGWHNLQKSVIGWLKVLAAGDATIAQGMSQHYRAPFEMFRDQPGALAHNPGYLAQPVDREKMVFQPLDYRGGPLRYTELADPMLRAVQNGLHYAEMLARRHGELLDRSAEARDLVAQWNAERKFLF